MSLQPLGNSKPANIIKVLIYMFQKLTSVLQPHYDLIVFPCILYCKYSTFRQMNNMRQQGIVDQFNSIRSMYFMPLQRIQISKLK